MPKIKPLFLVILLLAISASLSSQQLITPVAGVVTVDTTPAKAPYEVLVNATITSVVFTNQTPGQLITVLFLQDSTGHAVAFGGNILNACSVSQSANALTSCQFQYDARTVQWTGLGGGGGGTPGGSDTQMQYNNGGAFGGTSTTYTPATGATLVQPANSSSGIPLQVRFATGGSNTIFRVSNAGATNNYLTVNNNGPTVQVAFGLQSDQYLTTTNCAVNSVSPAACGSAPAGAFVVPTTTTTYTVNTSIVNTHSRIFLMPMSFASDLPSSPTCVVPAITAEPTISAIVPATSFTMSLASTTGQTCWQYWVVN